MPYMYMAVVIFKMLLRCNKNAHTLIKISSKDRYYLERIKDLILTRLKCTRHYTVNRYNSRRLYFAIY